MPFPAIWRRNANIDTAHDLYVRLVEQARQPAFYRDLQVPDSLDGRFDMIALHAFLVLRRLKAAGPQGRSLAQALFDVLFDDMDKGLREMGVADLGVGKRVKAMAQALYGRIDAYDKALTEGEPALAAALRRNLYGTTTPNDTTLAVMAGYLRREAAALDAVPARDLLSGKLHFGEPPSPTEGMKTV